MLFIFKPSYILSQHSVQIFNNLKVKTLFLKFKFVSGLFKFYLYKKPFNIFYLSSLKNYSKSTRLLKSRFSCSDLFHFSFLLFSSVLLSDNNVVSLICYINSVIFSKVYYSFLLLTDSIHINGYSRKAWLTKNKKHLKFKIGKSFRVAVFIPFKISLNLFKKRTIFLITFSKRLLFSFANAIHLLKPADVYKGAGIVLFSKNLVLKQKFKSKK